MAGIEAAPRQGVTFGNGSKISPVISHGAGIQIPSGTPNQNGSGSGDVVWKLGYQGDFVLTSGSDTDWFFAQHDANFASQNATGAFQLALFDNGDSRVPGLDGIT
jgi:hypothetical protein